MSRKQKEGKRVTGAIGTLALNVKTHIEWLEGLTILQIRALARCSTEQARDAYELSMAEFGDVELQASNLVEMVDRAVKHAMEVQ